jgi:hypothetical protein
LGDKRPNFVLNDKDKDVNLERTDRDMKLMRTGRISFSKEYFIGHYGFRDDEIIVI